uniref:Uncharacterized protein n=1 Tax=Desulfobacca acetoxidans TaxID=60893 RepID=A0A7V4LCJ4_9BACT
MRFFVTAADSQELVEVLKAEGVPYQMGKGGSIRELGTGSYEIYTVDAYLPEIKISHTDQRLDADSRAFQLPSGRLIITDLEGNLEQIISPPAGK